MIIIVGVKTLKTVMSLVKMPIYMTLGGHQEGVCFVPYITMLILSTQQCFQDTPCYYVLVTAIFFPHLSNFSTRFLHSETIERVITFLLE